MLQYASGVTELVHVQDASGGWRTLQGGVPGASCGVLCAASWRRAVGVRACRGSTSSSEASANARALLCWAWESGTPVVPATR